MTLFKKEKKRNKNMRLFFLFYFACVSEQITVKSEQKEDEEELCKSRCRYEIVSCSTVLCT